MHIHLRWLLALIALQTWADVNAQDTTVTWFDQAWSETSKEKGLYFRKAWKDGALWTVEDYYKSGNLQMTGTFISLDPKIKEGKFIFYNKEGSKTSEGAYMGNIKIGPWSMWYDDGSPDQFGRYMTDEEFQIDQRTSSVNNSVLYLADSLAIKTGVWEYYHYNGKISARINYDKGEITDASYWNEDGIEVGDDFQEDRMPSFPGGESMLMKYIADNIEYPVDALYDGIRGTVWVQFAIDINGDLNDPIILRSVSTSLDRETLRVFNEMPKWTPGIQANRRIEVKYNLPVKYSIGKPSKRTKKKKSSMP